MSRREILTSLSGDRLMLGGYLDLYVWASGSPTGTLRAGLSDLAGRWGCGVGEVRLWLERALGLGLVTRMDQNPEGSLYSVLGVVAKEEGAKYSLAFEEAWSTYPKSKGHSKSLAWKRWTALVNKHKWTEEDLIERVEAYAAECRALDREETYAKHMSSFLNHQYLEDVEFETAAPTPAGTGGISKDEIMGNLKGAG